MFDGEEELTPADVVIEALMHHRQYVERLHRKETLGKRRTFSHFFATSAEPPEFPENPEQQIQCLLEGISDRRSKSCRTHCAASQRCGDLGFNANRSDGTVQGPSPKSRRILSLSWQ
ncbi:hypothetical protein [Novipirellula artificiosorum]|uniref:hypothetical protein n=1 Tax=Novipirellula artificiosorum TaxID=2528016 RepID=UPI0018CEC628|nr:hypothetical protein [Novipirellula artificiosorum]